MPEVGRDLVDYHDPARPVGYVTLLERPHLRPGTGPAASGGCGVYRRTAWAECAEGMLATSPGTWAGRGVDAAARDRPGHGWRMLQRRPEPRPLASGRLPIVEQVAPDDLDARTAKSYPGPGPERHPPRTPHPHPPPDAARGGGGTQRRVQRAWYFRWFPNIYLGGGSAARVGRVRPQSPMTCRQGPIGTPTPWATWSTWPDGAVDLIFAGRRGTGLAGGAGRLPAGVAPGAAAGRVGGDGQPKPAGDPRPEVVPPGTHGRVDARRGGRATRAGRVRGRPGPGHLGLPRPAGPPHPAAVPRRWRARLAVPPPPGRAPRRLLVWWAEARKVPAGRTRTPCCAGAEIYVRAWPVAISRFFSHTGRPEWHCYQRRSGLRGGRPGNWCRAVRAADPGRYRAGFEVGLADAGSCRRTSRSLCWT